MSVGIIATASLFLHDHHRGNSDYKVHDPALRLPIRSAVTAPSAARRQCDFYVTDEINRAFYAGVFNFSRKTNVSSNGPTFFVSTTNDRIIPTYCDIIVYLYVARFPPKSFHPGVLMVRSVHPEHGVHAFGNIRRRRNFSCINPADRTK